MGVDENGLGARLGPLVVTAVLARVDETGDRLLSRRPPKRLRKDLDDSKQLISHGDVALGEAWARALVPEATCPSDLVSRLALEGVPHYTAPCPDHVRAQCWHPRTDSFAAKEEDVGRMRSHLAWWGERGVTVLHVKTSIVCTKRLNDALGRGVNRFVSDLHAMERLVLGLRGECPEDLLAVCGKVGGMEDYARFFGPLSQGLHAELERGRALSAYHFPKVGEIRFVRDADAKDCLVMLASMVGKYVRELLMSRISDFYIAQAEDLDPASGYHDPVTTRFVERTALLRKSRRIPRACFERDRQDP